MKRRRNPSRCAADSRSFARMPSRPPIMSSEESTVIEASSEFSHYYQQDMKRTTCQADVALACLRARNDPVCSDGQRVFMALDKEN